MRLDAVIFGGSVAGLWLLDRLSREGHHVVLLESAAIGAGQPIGEQPILGSGTIVQPSLGSRQITKSHRGLRGVWRDALLGRITPNLTRTRLRADCCFLWQHGSLSSRECQVPHGKELMDAIPMAGDERPIALANVAGPVGRLSDQIICPASLFNDLLNQYRDRILKFDVDRGLQFHLVSPGEVEAILLTSSSNNVKLELRPRQVVFTAGHGNTQLRQMAGLNAEVLSSRQIHIVLARGRLTELNSFCFDGDELMATVTTDIDYCGRTVWQISGLLTEMSNLADSIALTHQVRSRLTHILPGVDLRSVEWSIYPLEQTEGLKDDATLSERIQVFCAGNVTTGCPTRMLLEPLLAEEIAGRTCSPYINIPFDPTPLASWPRPTVAVLPWNEIGREWWTIDDLATSQHSQTRAA